MTHQPDRIAAWRREVDARPPLSRGASVSLSYFSRGLACELAREEGEPWRGYIRLPAGHPWIGAEEAGELLLRVGGHAGREITWSGPRADQGDAWWIGFDGVGSASSARRIIADLARLARMAEGR